MHSRYGLVHTQIILSETVLLDCLQINGIRESAKYATILLSVAALLVELFEM